VRARVCAASTSPRAALQVKVFTLFNPEARSALFMVPRPGRVLARRSPCSLTALHGPGNGTRVHGTIFASPVGRLEIVLGKLLPYLGLACCSSSCGRSRRVVIFDVPSVAAPPCSSSPAFFPGRNAGPGPVHLGGGTQSAGARKRARFRRCSPHCCCRECWCPSRTCRASCRSCHQSFQPATSCTPCAGSCSRQWPAHSLDDLVALTIFALAILVLATARFRRRLA